jgi:hypothetical protein
VAPHFYSTDEELERTVAEVTSAVENVTKEKTPD